MKHLSAFCNAGFDLMGAKGTAFASLTSYSDDALVNLTICALIVVGGMGYVVWSDIWDKKFRYRKYRLHTRIVLWATLILVFVPALLIYAFEHNGVLANAPYGGIQHRSAGRAERQYLVFNGYSYAYRR